MADHTFTLNDNAEAGWQMLTDKINAQKAAADVGAVPMTVDEVIFDQLKSTGLREFQRDKKAKKALSQAADDDEAIQILKARGYQVQGPRG